MSSQSTVSAPRWLVLLAPAASAAITLSLGALTLLGAKSCGAPAAPEPVCKVASDCEGLPHIACVGGWGCTTDGQCAWTCGPPPADGCSTDAQCGKGEYCAFDSGCAACKVAGGCTCKGTCTDVPPELPPGACLADSDCDAGLTCLPTPCPMIACVADPSDPASGGCPPCYGVCSKPPEPTGCASDADCGKGEACVKKFCPKAPCVISADGTVTCPPCTGQCEATGPAPCSANADCAVGETCEILTCGDGPCIIDPATGVETCPPCSGVCTPGDGVVGCQADSECKPGTVCSIECPVCITSPCPCIGSCIEPTVPPIPEPYECRQDSDCKSGSCAIEYCTKIACQPGLPCPICFGYCKEPTPTDQCQTDKDCAQGETCVLGPCPLAPCVLDPATGDAICPPCYGTCKASTPSCVVSGCSGQICASEPMASTCEWKDEYACYPLATCAPDASGACGWQKTDAFVACIEKLTPPTLCTASSCPKGEACLNGKCSPIPGGCSADTVCAPGETCVNGACVAAPKTCVVSGCSGQICAAQEMMSTCEWKPEYACYAKATCAVQANGACGWTMTAALSACLVGSSF